MVHAIEGHLVRDFVVVPQTSTLEDVLHQVIATQKRYVVVVDEDEKVQALCYKRSIIKGIENHQTLSTLPRVPLLTLPEMDALDVVDIAAFFHQDLAKHHDILGVLLLDAKHHASAILERALLTESFSPSISRHRAKEIFSRRIGGGVGEHHSYGFGDAIRSTVPDTHANIEERNLQITRHGNIQFPAQVPLDVPQELTITVKLNADAYARKQVELGLTNGEWPLQLSVTLESVKPLDFLIKGPSYGFIEVPREQDSEPLTFTLIPQSLGKKDIPIQFEQISEEGYDYIITTTLQTEVVSSDDAPVGNAEVHHAPTLTSACLPPDVTIYIKHVQGLHYNIYARVSGDTQHAGLPLIDEIDFSQPPSTYMGTLFADLDRKTNGGLSREEYDTEVRRVGNKLYKDLFHEEGFKRFYWTVLDALPEEATMQIISDEPYIPWEILRPYSTQADGRIVSDAHYLCERFALSRWLTSGDQRVDRIPLLKVSIVAPQSNLPSVEEEVEAIQSIPSLKVDVLKTMQRLAHFLTNGEADVLHFACHGAFQASNPGRSVLQIGDRYLQPDDLVGEDCNFGRVHPLVFLNACESGQQGIGLTSLDGWAKAFLDAGAGFFIGSMWKTTDILAYHFADTFYKRLLAGDSVSEAMRKARKAIMRSGDATYLSYTLYAHPRACARSKSQKR